MLQLLHDRFYDANLQAPPKIGMCYAQNKYYFLLKRFKLYCTEKNTIVYVESIPLH